MTSQKGYSFPPMTGELLAELMRTTPSAWAKRVRWIRSSTGVPAPYSFAGRPYLLEPHDSQARRKVLCMGSQTGKTELGLNLELHCILCMSGDCLHVLPQDEQIRTFVQGRVATAFEMSPDLKKVPLGASNPKHIRVGFSNWYFRGSNSLDTFVEIPSRMLVLDEYDRLNPSCIPLARERLTGTPEAERRELIISTPTISGRGIDAEYKASSMGRWSVPCPRCLERQPLAWGANLEPTEKAHEAFWKCGSCGAQWTEAERRAAVDAGQWVHEDLANPTRGWHMSQLYSPNETAASIVLSYLEAKRSDDPGALRVFWNSKLALPWTASDEGLTDADIDRAQRVAPYAMRGGSPPGALISMGVDQGPRRIHVSVSEWNEDHTRRTVVALYVVSDWTDLDDIMRSHAVTCCLADALPESRAARDFQARFPAQVWLAFYPDGMKDLVTWKDWRDSDGGPAGPFGLRGGYVQIHRTEAFDRLFARFADPPTILLPEDLPSEARSQLKVLTVVKGSDRFGNEVKRYDNGKRADHFAHAMLYDEIAGLQVGELGPAELPEDSGSADPWFAPMMGAAGAAAEEADDLGRRVTGI